MKRFAAMFILVILTLSVAAIGESAALRIAVGGSGEIYGVSGAEESVWYSEDDAIAIVSGGISSCTVTGVSVGSVRIVHRYVYSEYFSEYDEELGKTVTGTRSVSKKDYYPVEVIEGSAPNDAVTSPSQEFPVDTETSASQMMPAATAKPRANGEYAYKIYVTDEARAEIKKYNTLSHGSKGKAVKKMKERLVELGYLVCEGKINNKFDDATQVALFEFQVANNLTGSDGVAYAYTQYKLYDEFAIPVWGRYYYTLYCGDCGWDITNLQRRLCDTGYLAEKYVDGEFGQETMEAVMCFQAENGFVIDGVAYDWLQEVLFSPCMNSYGVE